MFSNKRTFGWAGALTLIGCLTFSLVWTPLVTHAGGGLPSRGVLPARETPEPDPVSSPERVEHSDSDDGGSVIGAYIELYLSGSAVNPWAVVQWQDQAGNWHNVEGWQGRLDTANYQRWWVAWGNFGQGPFRWIITNGPGGAVLEASLPFTLPADSVSHVQVTLSLEPVGPQLAVIE